MFVFSCRKDEEPEPQPVLKTFAELTMDDIKANEPKMSTTSITVSDGNGIKWNSGDIILYKTQLGKYGKMEVTSIDAASNYKMKFKAVTYLYDGWNETIVNNGLEVRGTWYCDLDTPNLAETDNEQLADFKNERLTATDTKLVSMNGAKFYKYK
ncbi:MAG TPA: hypothetical protein DIS75_08315 [Chryseobacterium sp.]|nr:hypothetical protein [Chryseobacterium sp.]